MKHRFLVLLAVISLAMGACGGGTTYSRGVSSPTPAPTLFLPPTVFSTTTAGATVNPLPVPSAIPFNGIPDNLIVFALDESVSVLPQGCPLSSARYDIPNLFIPLFQQYYAPNTVGTPSLSGYAPWIEVVRWPFKNYAIQATRFSDLNYQNSRINPKPSSSDAFFDEVFKYFYDRSNASDSQDLPKRSLILFTDGNFEGVGPQSTALDLQARAAAELEKLAGKQDVNLDVHVVLLCPKERMNAVDHNWWVAQRESYPNWFHLYEEKDMLALARSLWVNALKDKFPFSWDGDQQGLYLASNDGYWVLNSGTVEMKPLEQCKTADPRDRCINFSFSADSTGLHSGVITSNNELDSQSFIWKDDWIEKFPETTSDASHKIWDNKVTPVNGCVKKHSWIFNPGLIPNSPVLFWWRTASDVKISISPEENPLLIFYGDEQVNEESANMPIKILSESSIPLGYMSPCYDAVLSVEGIEVGKQEITTENDNVGTIVYNVKDEIEKKIPNISDYSPNSGMPVNVNVKILNHASAIMAQADINVQVLYIPTFLSDEYKPCVASGSFLGGNGSDYVCYLTFKYISKNFFGDNVDDTYQPYVYIVNKDGQECSDKFRVGNGDVGGGTINITNESDESSSKQEFKIEISGAFLRVTPYADCSDISSMSFKIVWDDWQPSSNLSPKNWTCNAQVAQCGGE